MGQSPEVTDVAPDLIEPIVGWRVWRVLNGTLRSLYWGGVVWHPGHPMDAACRAHSYVGDDCHSAPDEGCKCGLYATTDRLATTMLAARLRAADALGKVALWGKVIEGEVGYRAEHAYPVELWVTKRSRLGNAVLLRLEEDYVIPVYRATEF